MDPEVSFMLLCDPLQALGEHQIHVEISDRFNRQSFPEIEQHIEAVWSDRVAKEPWLFNGAKFRLHSAVLSVMEKGPVAEQAAQNLTRSQRGEGDQLESADKSSKDEQSCVLTLQLGLTCYKDYLGTNWSREAGRLQSHGQNECADPQAFLAQPLGVGAVMATADGDVVLLRRSQKVAEAAGLLDIPGGHPEPKMLCPGVGEEAICADLLQGKERAVVSEIFSSVCAEISDEVNVPVSSLSKPVFMGIALNHTSAGRPSAEFYVRIQLLQIVKNRVQIHKQEFQKTFFIAFLCHFLNSVLQKMFQLNERAPLWSEMCPSAKGAVLLYQRVMPDC
ncbi:nucleoside diphosphate-linked moiety X motif 22-like [Sinocyclocheilus rhinocerous]|uniref:nucleoside diphosphate-linked moiety X motif 22-like n=1 Tax=Sinocyclocheilus rhinocerous TaxID=307959 RepID=UPI0007B9E01F|nr:PREDICTED: nucleoside diphosphate-linked moiety X motif 22-like [Sinocyclocheilus rhinocerous]